MGFGYGVGPFGAVEPWGSVGFPAVPPIRQVGDFNFMCRALSEGFKIRVDISVPDPIDSPEFSRFIRVLRKQGEWPQGAFDPDAHVSLSAFYPTSATPFFIEDGLVENQTYYYALYALRTDGVWVHDRFTDRCSSYPYDRWGACDYMYNSLPRGYRSEDATVQHLYQFLCIFGALIDDTKTDVEHLLQLFEIDNIHDDLIFMLDAKIGWPTWHTTNGLQRRRETRRAVDLYKLRGRAAAYEQVLEEISDWDATIVEGWRYVMFSNGKYGSTTPDMTDPDTIALQGKITDILKYTNDGDGWHAVHGLGFFLEEVPGVSGPLTAEFLARVREMIEWTKASYVTTDLTAVTIDEELWLMSRVLDSFEDFFAFAENVSSPIEEDLGYTTTSWSLFESNDLTQTTNTVDDRTFHDSITYL